MSIIVQASTQVTEIQTVPRDAESCEQTVPTDGDEVSLFLFPFLATDSANQ